METIKGNAALAVKISLDIPLSKFPFWKPIGGNIANMSPAVTPPVIVAVVVKVPVAAVKSVIGYTVPSGSVIVLLAPLQ